MANVSDGFVTSGRVVAGPLSADDLILIIVLDHHELSPLLGPVGSGHRTARVAVARNHQER